MDRRSFISSVTLGLLAAPLAAGAQPVEKVPRVGVLVLTPRASVGGVYVDALRQGLRDLGYVEGKSITLEVRWAEGEAQRLPQLAAELVNMKVDVLITSGTEAIRAAQKATREIPVIMATVSDPVALGIAASLARPGGNLTGLAILSPELTVKRLQLLTEVVPAARRVGVVWNPANQGNDIALRAAETAARRIGLDLVPLGVQRIEELRTAFGASTNRSLEALLVIEDSMLVSHTDEIVRLTGHKRLPTMYGFRSFVEAGGLIAYGPVPKDMWRQASVYVDKILRGATPASLPIEQPIKIELVINLKTAKALGVTIPQSLLQRADQVIE